MDFSLVSSHYLHNSGACVPNKLDYYAPTPSFLRTQIYSLRTQPDFSLSLLFKLFFSQKDKNIPQKMHWKDNAADNDKVNDKDKVKDEDKNKSCRQN